MDSTENFEKETASPVAAWLKAISPSSAELPLSPDSETPCYTNIENEGVARVASSQLIDGQALRSSDCVFQPSTDFEREEVRNQLREILASPGFQNSKRYAAVLTYIVEETLAGHGDRLKERTIGIEVFRRACTYDTAADHVVRSAAREIRKRLSQHYQVNVYTKVIIDVLPGSYVPQFRWAEKQPALLDATPALVRGTSERLTPPAVPAFWGDFWIDLSRKRALVAFLILAVSLASWGVVFLLQRRDPFERFWMPVLSSRVPVLLCIGNVEGGLGSPGEVRNLSPTLSLAGFHNSPYETVNVFDVSTMTEFARFLESRRRRFEFKSQSDATFTDLQNGPAILVGLQNNNWTGRLVSGLRFTVEHPNFTKVIIRDRKNPSSQEWSVDYATPYLDVTRDYALVLRMADPKTEQTVVVAAGITVFGTDAAGKFLTSKNEMKKLSAIAPPGWEKKNMELVLSTDVIRGRSGPATIIAAEFW
jgi:hypothetical protein